MAIKEPYVKITEHIIDYPSVSNIDDSSLMAGVINAQYGPDHALIQGPGQFLDTFTIDDKISRGADSTVINAYFCSFFAPIVLKRAWNLNSDSNVSVINYDIKTSVISSESVDSSDLPYNPGDTELSGKIIMKYPIDAELVGSIAESLYDFTVGLSTVKSWNTSNDFDSIEFKNITDSEATENKLVVIYWKGTKFMTGYKLVSYSEFGINPLTDSAVYYKDVLDSDSVPFTIDLSAYSYETLATTNSIEFGLTSSDKPVDYNIINPADDSTVGYGDAWKWIDENSDIYNISYVSTFGSPKENDTVSNLAGKNKWFYFMDADYSDLDAARGKVDTNEPYRTMLGGPSDWSSAVTPWRTSIAASSLYWQRVYANKASNSEFAPVFDITNGIMNYQKPVKQLTKTERETMLSDAIPVNWVKYDRTNRVYYLNDNRTATKKQNVMNEEMNVRMINKIQRDMMSLLPRYKGTLNNDKTRLDCKGLLENYMDTSIMSQNYRPVEYKIVCDRTNNTDAVINANKLAVTVYVRLQGSIKYIEVLNKIYPLGVAFES